MGYSLPCCVFMYVFQMRASQILNGSKRGIPSIRSYALICLCWILQLSTTYGQTNFIVTKAEITQALKVSKTIQALSDNPWASARDQAWVAFMIELYKRDRDVLPESVAAAYATFTNKFQATFMHLEGIRHAAIPSASEIFNTILSATTEINHAPFAVHAAQLASQSSLLTSPLFQGIFATNSESSGSALLGLALQQASQSGIRLPQRGGWLGIVTNAMAMSQVNDVFRAAYDQVISPITKVSQTDTLENLFEKLPGLQSNFGLTNLLGQLDELGTLAEPQNAILSVFTNQVGRVFSTIDQRLGSIASVLEATTSTLPDYLQTSLEGLPGSLDRVLQQSQHQLLGDAAASIDFLQTLLTPFDENLAGAVGSIGQTVASIGDALNDFDPGSLVGSLTDLIEDPVGAVIGGVLGSFFGSSKSSSDEKILKNLSELSQQMQQIQGTLVAVNQQMNTRFDRVDQALNTIYGEMLAGFDAVHTTLNQVLIFDIGESNKVYQDFQQLSYSLAGINGQLFRQGAQLELLSRNVYDYFTDAASQKFKKNVLLYLDYQSRLGFPMAASTYFQSPDGPEASFWTWAIQDSVDPQLWAPSNSGSDISNLTADFNRVVPSANRINIINGFQQEAFGLPPWSTSLIPNPTIWGQGANAYIQLTRENPALFHRQPDLDLRGIQKQGRVIENAIASITYTNGLRPGVNWPLWNAVFDFYRQQVGGLALALGEASDRYTSTNPIVQGVDLIHETNFVTIVAGAGPASNIDGVGATAAFADFGAICPASDQGIRGLAFQKQDRSYRVRAVHPDGTVVTEALIPRKPLLEAQDMKLDNDALVISSFAATLDGTAYVTVANRGVGTDGQSDVFFSNLVLEVVTNGAKTVDGFPIATFKTVAGSPTIYDSDQDSDGATRPNSNQKPLFTNPAIVGIDGRRLLVIDHPGNNIPPYSHIRLREILDDTVHTLLVDGPLTNMVTPSFNIYQCCSDAWPNSQTFFQWSGQRLVFLPDKSILIPVARNVPGLVRATPFYGNLLNFTPLSLNGIPPGFGFPDGEYLNGIVVANGGASSTSVLQIGLFGNSLSTYSIHNNQTVTQWWASSPGAPELVQDARLATVSLDLGPGSSMAADQDNNLYVISGDPYPKDGSQRLLRIGAPWKYQRELFKRWLDDFSDRGADPNVFEAFKRLTTTKDLIRELVNFGLSESIRQDDLMRSMLYGTEGLLDPEIAKRALNVQVSALQTSPQRPVVDLPTLASNRLDVLQAQVNAHLLEVQSRASLPTDDLVFDLLIEPKGVSDSSSLHHTILTPSSAQVTEDSAAERLSIKLTQTTDVHTDTTLEVPTESNLVFGLTSDFSLGFWGRISGNGELSLGDSRIASNSTWRVECDRSGAIQVMLRPENSAPIEFHTEVQTNLWSSDEWFYVTVVFSRSAQLEAIYINGVRIHQELLAHGLGAVGSGQLFISGRSPNNIIGSGAFVNEVCVWRRALGENEVASIYRAGIAQKSVKEYAANSSRSSSPTEPQSFIRNTLQDLEILLALHSATPPTPRVELQSPVSKTGIVFTIRGEPGATYDVFSSRDLLSWNVVASNTREGSTLNLPVGRAEKAVFLKCQASDVVP